MVDGRLVGKRSLPKHEWLTTAGRNIAEVGFETDGDKRGLVVRISDIHSQEMLYESRTILSSRVTVLEPGMIAIYEPTGSFRLIDVASGKPLIDTMLEPVADANAIYAMPANDKLFLFISSPPNQQYKPLVQQSDYPLVNGLVYALDMKSGEAIWPAPAVVRNRGIVLSQPSDIPLLVFADRKLVRDPTTGGGSQLRVLCIDQRTGEAVYSRDTLPDTSITRFRIRGDREGEATVAIEMSANRILLTLTDQPRPIGSPANDDTAAKSAPQDTGLGGLGRRITGALRGALDKAEPEQAAKPADADDD
jgi:hypothetical protein